MGTRRKLLWAAVCLAGGLALLSVSDSRGFRRYFRLDRDVASLSARNAKLVAENAGLLRDIEGLRRDPRALERAAREELGFIRPGEIVVHLGER